MTEEERKILEEQYFRYDGITYEENQFYLNLLKNCQDIQSPMNFDEKCSGQLVEVSMKKTPEGISFNGSVSYELSDGKIECRCINGYIWKDKDFFIVDTKVERLSVDVFNKMYATVDKFIVNGNTIVSRTSGYNYEMPKKYTDDNIRIALGGRKR